MAIAFDVASGGHVATTTSLTWSHTCSGENRILFVGTRMDGTATISSVTYNGVALTPVQTRIGADLVSLYMLVNPASGSNTVAVNLTSSKYIVGISSSYNGADQISQPDSSNTRTASTTTSGNISTTVVVTSSWSVLIAKAASSSITGGVNATIRATGDNAEMAFMDSNGALAAGSQTMACTSAGNANWMEVIASFDPYISPSGGSPMLFGGGVTIG